MRFVISPMVVKTWSKQRETVSWISVTLGVRILRLTLPQSRTEFLNHPGQAASKTGRVQLQLRTGLKNRNMLDDLGKLTEQLVKNRIDISKMLDQICYWSSFSAEDGLNGC